MNHLKNEKSPYLLQHRENPVDWFPWGNEALPGKDSGIAESKKRRETGFSQHRILDVPLVSRYGT